MTTMQDSPAALTAPPTSHTLLDVEHLSVDLLIGGERRRVVTDVTLQLTSGESLGLVGESGSGKSISSRAILRTLGREAVVGGQVRFDTRDVYAMNRKQLRAWHASEVALIHQDPRACINPLHPVGDFLTEALRCYGVTKHEAEERAVDLLMRVGIGDAERRLRQYPHQLSGGLLQRVMIAAALLASPQLLIADEPTTALDVTTQEDVVAILDQLRREQQLGLVFITHDLDLAAAITDRIAVMYAGTIVESGPSHTITQTPRHPYTAGLLRSRPSSTSKRPLQPIPGRPIAAYEVEAGCAFADRCAFATTTCQRETPALRPLDGHLVACHRAEEITDALTGGQDERS